MNCEICNQSTPKNYAVARSETFGGPESEPLGTLCLPCCKIVGERFFIEMKARGFWNIEQARAEKELIYQAYRDIIKALKLERSKPNQLERTE